MSASSADQGADTVSTGRFERPGVVHRRLFYALWPDAQQQTALAHAARKAIKANGGQAVAVSNLHLTLLFLGAVPEGRMPELVTIARRVAAAFPMKAVPLQFTFDRLEHWKKPQVLCAIPAEADAAASVSASQAAATLAEALRFQLVAVGFTPDLKPFRAHVTLARKVQRPKGELHMDALPWSCSQLALVQSRTQAGGALYSVVDSWLLAKWQIV